MSNDTRPKASEVARVSISVMLKDNHHIIRRGILFVHQQIDKMRQRRIETEYEEIHVQIVSPNQASSTSIGSLPSAVNSSGVSFVE